MGHRRHVLAGLLMSLYPRWFRRARGAELRRSYEDVLAEVPRGRLVGTALWLFKDAVVESLRIRADRRMRITMRLKVGMGTKGEGAMTGRAFSELRHAARSLARSPGFAVVAILTLGLGIGANTAIFSVVYGVLVAPIPYQDPAGIVEVQNRYLPSGSRGWVSAAELSEFRTARGALEAIVPVSPENMNLTGLLTPLRLEGMRVGPGFFRLLGLEPALGREFTEEEGAPGGASVVILGDGLWRTAFGADPEILGRTVELDAQARTVVGVMGPDYRPISSYLFAGREEVFWVPLVIDPTTFDARSVERHNLLPIGRLAAGLDPSEAEKLLQPAVRALVDRYPDISNADSRDVAIVPIRDQALGGAGRSLMLLSVAVGLVLLVACVNVANLLFARADARATEGAVRAAMGASRGRLLWYAVSEAVLIGLAGGLLGIGMTAAGRGLLVTLLPPSVAIPDGLELGLPVLAFTVALSLASGGLAGLLPALATSRGDVYSSIRAGGQGLGSSTKSRALLQRMMVVGQIAGAVVLVASASLLVRSMVALRSVDPGFEVADRHLVAINATRVGYPDGEAVRLLYTRLIDRVEELEGVEAAAASWQTPQQTQMSDWPVFPERTAESEWFSADPNLVSPGYFDTYGIELVAGRLFERGDADRAVGPVILNRTGAERLWPGQSAIGHRVNLSFGDPVWREVVGVVEDVRGRGLAEEPRVQTYMTFGEGPYASIPSLTLTTRGRLAGDALSRQIQGILAGIDSDIPVGGARSLEAQVASTVARERLLSVLLTVFAGVTLLLGAIGVYGIVSISVRRRTREIGLRIAIGARPESVLARVVRQGLAMGGLGVGIGIGATYVTGRLLESFLYDVSRADPTTLVLVSAGVLAVSVMASFIPARRAAAVDPLTALRD